MPHISYAPETHEALIQEHIKAIEFEQFIDDAVVADKHYRETGLHVTHEEVGAWIKSLKNNPNAQAPVCHE